MMFPSLGKKASKLGEHPGPLSYRNLVTQIVYNLLYGNKIRQRYTRYVGRNGPFIILVMSALISTYILDKQYQSLECCE